VKWSPEWESGFRGLFAKHASEVDADAVSRACAFAKLVLNENEIQNLTRLVTPESFFDGFVWDCLTFLKSDSGSLQLLDLGSGAGVPGLLCACLDSPTSLRKWTLVDSEKKKADFLTAAVMQLGLTGAVSVVSGRGEVFLANTKETFAIVAKAVGPVGRIYSWIRECSTWNKLVLFKGPAWNEEWASFQLETPKSGLKVINQENYSSLDGLHARKIITIERNNVPRRTV